ncbi:MAG: B12-binding domain-containing radical SAM protein, partial [Desulfosudaceae bacterium]
MKKRVLLSSVYKPFGINTIDARHESKIELFHNQLTRNQGIYSPRFFLFSHGLHAIANNLDDTPVTVLDFPSLKRFQRELRKGYDVVGISAIVPNFTKAKRMVETVRALSPGSTVVIGGFCAAVPEIEKIMDVDHVCVGEGISFMRRLLGQSQSFNFKNPDTVSQLREVMGIPLRCKGSPHIVVGLGCSYGCDFCCPSHFFGKRHIRFFRSGQALFEEIEKVAQHHRTNNISLIGDDNFLLDLDRAEQLRQCMIQSNKQYRLFTFGSADKIVEFGAEKLAEMGVNLIWIGRESLFSTYQKNQGQNLQKIIADLRRYGIKVILSSILLVDEHTRENIETDIADHLDCRPTFSQFAFYSPLPGTPLFDRMSAQNKILTAIPFEEWHAFKQPWFTHPEFSLLEAEKIQNRAYDRDFQELGPSLMRYIQTDYEAWRFLKDSAKPHLTARAGAMAAEMGKYRILLLAMRHLLSRESLRKQAEVLLKNIEQSFGPATAIEKTAGGGY